MFAAVGFDMRDGMMQTMRTTNPHKSDTVTTRLNTSRNEEAGCIPNSDVELAPLQEAAAGMRVALAHDWLTGMRGGERVLEYFCRAFPDATLSTLISNPASVSDTIRSHSINASPLNRIPGIAKSYRNFLPLMPAAARMLQIPQADLLISASHCVAKSFRKPRGSKHVCVCFTPMRYAWTFFGEYFGGSRAKAALAKPLLAALRNWDKAKSDEVDSFIAISQHVADRIKRFYGRDSQIVYPPVDLCRCVPADAPREHEQYDLIVSALVPYKRVDLAVELYTRKGWRLKVVGTGGEFERLKQMAGPTVEMFGPLSDAEIVALYQRCRMLVFPGEEDYGIVPLEAQACGRPVAAFGRGGALETIADGTSGVFFSEQTLESLEDAVTRCAAVDWNSAAIRAHAENFGPAQFIAGIAKAVEKVRSVE